MSNKRKIERMNEKVISRYMALERATWPEGYRFPAEKLRAEFEAKLPRNKYNRYFFLRDLWREIRFKSWFWLIRARIEKRWIKDDQTQRWFKPEGWENNWKEYTGS